MIPPDTRGGRDDASTKAHGPWIVVAVVGLTIVVALGARCDAGVEGGEVWTLGDDAGPGASSEHAPAAHAPADPEDPADPEAQIGDGEDALDGGVPVERPDAQAVALAQYMQSFVYEQPDPRAARVGYLRAGAYVAVGSDEPVNRRGCADGWYPIESGFVCNRRGFVVTRSDPTQRYRPTQPNLDASVPYRWAHNSRDGTPMYRQAPTRAMVQAIEGPRDAGAPDAGRSPAPTGAVATSETADPAAAGGTANDLAPSAGAAEPATTDTASAPATTNAPGAEARSDAPDRNEEPPASAPATRATAPSPGRGARPTERPATPTRAADQAPATAAPGEEDVEAERPTLRTLRGDGQGPLVRRLMRGFMISIDRATRSDGMSFYRSLSGGYVPTSRFYVLTPTVFNGAHLVDTVTLPIAFLMSGSVPRMRTEDGSSRTERVGSVERKEWVQIVGRRRVNGQEYFELPGRVIVRAQGFRVLEPRPPPPDLGEGEKWVDVDLATQSLVAYEGARPVFATLMSSGRLQGPTGSDRDFTTRTGDFRLESKHITATMQGDTAAEGPYSIEDVPWAMFFHLSYALHGAFWHSRFGRTKSHGCVNLSVQDARWLFDWIEPVLPPGWHGVYASERRPGTRVIVRGQTPRG